MTNTPYYDALSTLAHTLVTQGQDTPSLVSEESARRIMLADKLAAAYIDHFSPVTREGWPRDAPPGQYALCRAIMLLTWPDMISHAIACARFQVELHHAGPGDQYQILSHQQGNAWVGNAIGPKLIAQGGYEIELAMRGAIIHMGRHDGFDVSDMDMSSMFTAIDAYCQSIEDSEPFPTAITLAKHGMRESNLGEYLA